MIGRKEIVKIVKRRVNRLLALAKGNERERDYVKKAWKLLTKYRIRQTKEEKIRFCKRCFSLWDKGRYKVSIDKKNKRIIYECLNCSYKRKFRYK